MNALWLALQDRFSDQARRDEPLAAHTTLRLGGPADIWFPARSVDQLITAVSLAREFETPLFILGGGANILIRDAGLRGFVIENWTKAVKFQETGALVESGVIIPRLAKQCAQRGLSGLEWAVGVPGTIGGAVVNNAGAYGKSMADILVRAELLTEAGERMWQPVDWFDYGYRYSRLKAAGAQKAIVLQAELAFAPAPVETVEATMQQFNERRKATQPPGATIGSMFKNPPGDYAGRLIEAVGLKGYRLNQAQISPIHANFFVNLGEAKADDIIHLIEIARQRVFEQTGVELELEVEIVG